MTTPDLSRYARQIIFPDLGEAGQRRLHRSTVVLIGCGATGTVIANHPSQRPRCRKTPLAAAWASGRLSTAVNSATPEDDVLEIALGKFFALEMAVRHLLRWLQPGPDPESSRRLAENFEKWLADAQPGGLPPNSLRFAHSARQRGMPLAIESGLLGIGWG